MKTKIKHSVMTGVKTPKRTYTVSVSQKGIRVSNKVTKKYSVHWSMSWKEYDEVFDKHLKEKRGEKK